MKEYIGIVKMKVYKSNSILKPLNVGTATISVRFDKDCAKAINSKEIVFKPEKLKIFIPTIDDYKRYKVCEGNKFGFAHKTISNEEFEGLYKMYKKEEYFILKKVKE